MGKIKTDDVYYVTMSKGRVWAIVIFSWAMALMFIVGGLIALFIGFIGPDQTNIFKILLLCILFLGGGVFLVYAANSYLKYLHGPVATLTKSGFAGPDGDIHLWSRDTFQVWVKGNLTLASPEAGKTRKDYRWKGCPNSALVYINGAKQKRKDVLAAIERLNPYK